MNDINSLLVNDPEFTAWSDGLDNSDLEAQMAEDGYNVDLHDDYEDGHYERSGR
ncbi:MAG: hypothetical protein AABY22_05540 [Nanoarchaeota archaeon]